MTQIKIEVPANDTIALSALGAALTRIATERNGAPTFDIVEHCESFNSPKNDDHVEQVIDEIHEKFVKADVKFENTTTEQEHDDPTTDTDDTLDADGLPWDKRIHSGGKSRLADNTWRLARKPADKSQEEWDEYVNTVKSELKAVQSIPTALSEHPLKDEVVKKLESGEVTIEAPITPPIVEPTPEQKFDEAVLPPVETVTPPVVEAPIETVAPPVVESKVSTFPELMKWITSEGKKRGVTNDMIKETLVEIDPALTGLPLIATRADLIPTLVEKLEARLV